MHFVSYSNEEDQQHHFIDSHFAKQVWNSTHDLCPYTNGNPILLNDWLNSLHSKNSSELSQLSRALLSYWQLWNERNNVVFRSIQTHPSRVPLIASLVGNDYFKANLIRAKENIAPIRIIKWKAPCNHLLKINFDGSV